MRFARSLPRRRFLTALGGLTALLAASAARAEPPRISVAAAANLLYVLGELNAEFRRHAPEVGLTTTTGASGSLFAQIQHGAPFDVFLSADTDYPRQLVRAGLGEAASLRTFATGRLVLWTTREDLPLSEIAAALRSSSARKIALAQPKSAPYGRAAQRVLERLELWRELQPRLVFGESVAQTAQFVETGNADLGFVALSLVQSPRLARKGRWVPIAPESFADVSLDHAAVVTRRGAANPVAARYLEFLASEPAKKILRDFGYAVPK